MTLSGRLSRQKHRGLDEWLGVYWVHIFTWFERFKATTTGTSTKVYIIYLFLFGVYLLIYHISVFCAQLS